MEAKLPINAAHEYTPYRNGTKLKLSQTPAFNGINMVLNCTLISSSTFQTSKLQYYLQLLHLTKTRINGHEKLEIGNGKLRKNIPEAM